MVSRLAPTLLALAEQQPEAPMFVDAAGRVDGRAHHTARVLSRVTQLRDEFDLDPADRFAVLATNSIDYIGLWHAAFFGGGVIVPVNHRLAAPEIEHILTDAHVRAIFVDDANRGLLDTALAGVPSVRHVVGIDHELPTVKVGSASMGGRAGVDEPVTILYTGGTTGRPKGAVHTERSLMSSADRVAGMFSLDRPDTCVHLPTPLFHIASLVGSLAAPTSGARTYVASRFDADSFVAEIETHGITHAGMVTTMLSWVLGSSGFDAARVRTLRCVSYGGEPMPPAVLDRVQRELPWVDLFNAYGMTEAGTVCFLGGEEHRARGPHLGSVGRPLPGIEIELQDSAGTSLGGGTVGEVCLRSDGIMAGYHNRPAETDEAFRDGWFRTGDLGRFDDGHLYIVDRLKDMIITGGENVYSAEVEHVIGRHPDVAEVAVIGLPDARWGEAVHAIVVPRTGAILDAQAVIDHTHKHLAGYKCPKSVELRSEPLPISAANKVLKRLLRNTIAAPPDS